MKKSMVIKRLWICILAVCLIQSSWVFAAGQAGGNVPKDEDEAWKEDLKRKMDNAVDALGIVKDELENIPEEQLAGPGNNEDAAALGEKVKGTSGLIARIWRRIKEKLGPDPGKTGPDNNDPLDENAMKDLEKNVDVVVSAAEKVQKIMAEYSTEAAQRKPGAGGDEKWSDDLAAKVGTAIKIMEALKEEMGSEDKGRE